MYTEHDCTDESLSTTDIKGRYIIIKEEFFGAEFKDEKYQLVLATGGFGCNPENIGNAIFVKELFEDGERYRIDRCDRHILGLASEKVIAEYTAKYLQPNETT